MNQEFIDAVTLLVKHAEATGEGRELLEAASLVRSYVLAEGVDFIDDEEEVDPVSKIGKDTSGIS